MKKCTKCGVEQPLENFYRATGTRDGLRGDCKACFRARAKARYPLVRDQAIERARQWRIDNIERYRENQRRMRSKPESKLRERAGHLKRKYGMTLEEYEEMLAAQDGRCAICRRLPADDTALHIDHDHETGRVRGLLCFTCNNALGDFDDDPSRLRAAVGYVESTPEDAEVVALVRARVRALVARA